MNKGLASVKKEGGAIKSDGKGEAYSSRWIELYFNTELAVSEQAQTLIRQIQDLINSHQLQEKSLDTVITIIANNNIKEGGA